ncbi:MAG: hypothetical protein ACRD20_11155 [Terriglobales bacterium]
MLERIRYRGWENAYRISNATIELVALADVGPRIVSLGFIGGENVFHEVPEQAGLTGGSDFRLYGGHRLWIWPEVARTYFPDNSPVAVSQGHNQVRFTAPSESAAPGSNLQKEVEIRLDEGARVTVNHRVTNRDNCSTELALWAPTMMKAGGRAILPLPPRAAMDKDHFQSVGPLALWSFTDFADSRWALGTEYVQLQQQANPTGRFREQMTGVYNPAGWGAYFLDGALFLKSATVTPGAVYPDFGCNFEVFTNPDFLELESLGPKVRLNPGESAGHTETWTLFRNVPEGKNDSWIRSAILPLAYKF